MRTDVMRVFCCLSLLALLSPSAGCSSMGLSLWPAQFPLLTQTKQFAAQSPLPNGLPNELSKQVLAEYYVEPGDRVLIEPVQLDSKFRMIGDQLVQVDGSIDLGTYGRMRVAGLTVESIEAAIEEEITRGGGEREQINVQLVETNASEVYVLGEVGSPGAYNLDGNDTVLDAILRAGGLTSNASPCNMILVRPTEPCDCRVVLPVCYRQITQLGDVSSNYQLQPGDRIVVGSRSLFEELAVWKQTRGCKRCCQSRCVECRPETVAYGNRFLGTATPFAIPFFHSREAGEQAPAQSPPPLPGDDAGQDHGDINSDADDSDLYLPSSTETGQVIPARRLNFRG